MSQGKPHVCIALFQHLWFMWWKSEACCEERSPGIETNTETPVQQRTSPSSLLGEMFLLSCQGGEGEEFCLMSKLWFAPSSLTRFPWSDNCSWEHNEKLIHLHSGRGWACVGAHLNSEGPDSRKVNESVEPTVCNLQRGTLCVRQWLFWSQDDVLSLQNSVL